MIKLKPSFQTEIFQKIIREYNGSINAKKYLGIPASSIRGYKNLYFNCVPNTLLQKIIALRFINKNELEANTLGILDKSKIIQISLDLGRKKRNENLQDLKKDIPSLQKIMDSNVLDVVQWIKKYVLLSSAGFRKIKISEKRNYLVLDYNNFTKNGLKNFKVKIPKTFKLDEEFLYFFGLWCGDRAGGKRFGICNKNKKIIQFTTRFLQKNYQPIEKILYISEKIEEPKINYDKKFIIEKESGGWALSVHSTNGILSSFFHYLLSNLDLFLNLISNPSPFFAGLFDAEGNVSLYNKSFRWACKSENLVDIYSKHLKQVNLYSNYDGGCLVSYNLEKFYDKILPYLKHDKKINLTLFLCKGEGKIPKVYLFILNYLKKCPEKTAKEISKALKKNKVYSELNILENFAFISRQSYPYKYKLTNKGLTILGGK